MPLLSFMRDARISPQNSLFNSYAELENGFRGIQWGTSSNKYIDVQLTRTDGDIKIYKKKNEILDIQEGTLASIDYHFWKDAFYEACLVVEGEKNWNALKKEFNSKIPALFTDTEIMGIYVEQPGRRHYNLGQGIEAYELKTDKFIIFIIYRDNLKDALVKIISAEIQTQIENIKK